MFRKLVAFELKTAFKNFMIVFGLLLALLVANWGLLFTAVALSGFWTTLVLGVYIAVAILLFTGLLKIFNANTFGDGGYFTMMLPVSTRLLIAAKLTAAAVWIGLTIIAVLVSLLGGPVMGGGAFGSGGMWRMVTATMGMNHVQGLWFAVLLAASLMIGSMSFAAQLFLACAVSNIEGFGKVAGVLVFVVLGRLESAVLWLLPLDSDMDALIAGKDGGGIMMAVGVSVGLSVAVIVLSFFGICWILERKLSLK